MKGPGDESTLPHDLEAERSILGAVLLHNDAYEVAAKWLTPTDFYRQAHRTLFGCMGKLLDQPGGLVDLVTLRSELGKEDLKRAGGAAYVTSLVDGVPRSMNVAHYAQIVKDKALLRALIELGNVTVSTAYAAQQSGEEVLRSTDAALVVLAHGTAQGRMSSLASTNAALLEDMQYRVDHKGELRGVTTGFQSINEMTMGWQPGALIVVAARPSVGKTSWALNCATAVAATCRPDGSPRRVAVFSMEMRRQQLEYRILSSLSGLPLSRILNGYVFGDEEWRRLSAATQAMHAYDLHIDDTAGRSALDIRAECRRLRAERGLDLVVIDYVQLMASSLDRRGANRNDEVTDISRKLKALTNELSVPILLLSQLNRASADRADPRPKLTDLRESGALEQDADAVAFLHRKHHREGGTTNFILEKDRDGPGGTVNLTLDRDTVTFTDGGEDPPPPSAEEQEAEKKTRAQSALRRKAHSRR